MSITFDDRTATRLDRIYRSPEAVRRRGAVLRALGARPGDHVLDIGCGPGFLTRELADQVGPWGEVQAIDVAPAMLEAATVRCRGRGVRFSLADAASLPVPDSSFDRAASIQVFEYIPRVDLALRELWRVLRPGAMAVVVSTDWASLQWHTPHPQRMAQVVQGFADHCAHADLPHRMPELARAANFQIGDAHQIGVSSRRYDPASFGAQLVDIVKAFVVDRGKVPRAMADAWEDDLLGMGEDFVFQLDQYLISLIKPA